MHHSYATRLSKLLFIITVLLPCLAQAASSALYSGNGFNDANYSITFGMEFTPKVDMRVTALGVLDGGLDGPHLQSPHDVGLWQNDGTLLASTTVLDADIVANTFHYRSITPVVLSAGVTYVVGAYYPLLISGDKLVASSSPTSSPFVTLGSGARYTIGASLAFPTSSNPDFRIAANLLFEPVDTTKVDINGVIGDSNGGDLCAMVLASGKHMFSCNPLGAYALNSLPRRADGTVKLQVYTDGYLPYSQILIGSGTYDIAMTAVGTCPQYNPGYTPGVYPGSAGQQVTISGRIYAYDSGANEVPVCAMVLASGKYIFSCSGNGTYNMTIPLNSSGQYKLQVYADGYTPYSQKFDEFQTANDVRMTPVSECN